LEDQETEVPPMNLYRLISVYLVSKYASAFK
jgi:hypothetical protein